MQRFFVMQRVARVRVPQQQLILETCERRDIQTRWVRTPPGEGAMVIFLQ